MKRAHFIALVSGGVCLIAALAVVLAVMLSRSGGLSPAGKTFLEGTTLNGVDVSGLDAEGAAAALEQRAQDYSFTLKLGEDSYTATGSELDMAYDPATDLAALLEQQKQDATQLAFDLEGAFTFDAAGFLDQVKADYDSRLAQAQAEAQTLAAEAEVGTDAAGTDDAAGDNTEDGGEGEEAQDADPNAPQNAYLQYDAAGATFIIVPDQPGKDVDWDAVSRQVQAAVEALEPELALDLEELVEQADVTADDPQLQAALEEANSYLDLELTYTFTPDGGSTSSVTLDRDTLGSIYFLDPEDLSVQVDEEILGSYVASLAEQYSVSGTSTRFKTTGGSYINITVTEAGQSVDSSALYDDMLECLRTKTGGTRAAPYADSNDSDAGYWGGNYVEIDLTSQHLWLYKDGACILSCDVVSGCVADDTRTPTGCFQIFAKNTDRYLNGTNVDGSRYRSWVNYFMPFSGGCGIHDATWRSSFGGDIYLYNGSHGCVGVTLSNAKTIYNNVSVGTHVVVYGGASPDNIPARTQNITATLTNSTLVVGDQTTVSVSSKTTPQFTSSNPAVATVDASGNVSAVGPGTAEITVYCPAGGTYGDATAKVTVTVSAPAHVHTWVEQTQTIHHDAEYETVENTVVTGIRCDACGNVFETKEAFLLHQQEAASSGGSSSGSSSGCAASSGVEVTETTTEQILVKDAWDETAVTGYVCSGCGETRTTAP